MARHALQKADVLLQALAFAHHRDVPPAVQLAVAGGAAADPLAQQPVFAGDLPACRHAGGQDQAAPFIEIRPGADSIVPAHLVDRRHPCLLDWDAKIIHLPQKSVPQLPAGHPGQAGVIQDTLCLFDLVTEPPAAKPEERKPPGPGGQRGRYPGRAGAHDQQIPHERRLLSIFYYAVYRAHRRRSRGIVYLVRNPAYFAGARLRGRRRLNFFIWPFDLPFGAGSVWRIFCQVSHLSSQAPCPPGIGRHFGRAGRFGKAAGLLWLSNGAGIFCHGKKKPP